MRLPTSRPYMSGNAAMTVSTSSSATIRLSVSVSMQPCILSSRPYVDIHRLPLRIVLQRRHPQLPPQPALLYAAEWRLEVDAAARVDRQVAGLHGARDAQRAADVACPDRAGQAVVAVVGQADGIRFIVERHHRHDG